MRLYSSWRIALLSGLLFSGFCAAQESNDTKVVLITMDGLRWQELFTGADSLLVSNEKYVNDPTELKKKYWAASPEKRREALMPFFWKEVSKMGRIHGNRYLGSKVNLTNTMWFSYPGYNEILTGKADDARIDSNDKIPNPNTTILEIANEDPRYKGKVAAFGSWDVFPYIINEERSGVPVNAGFEVAEGNELTVREKFLNAMQSKIPSPWGAVRLDAFTHYYALEHMKKNHPSLIYIAYGETDDFAHDGDYEAYLKSAHTTDAMIGELWDFTQNDPFYKNNTLFIVTTDHGRGTDPLETWKDHGSDVKGAGGVWLLLFGKGVAAKEVTSQTEQLFSDQVAPTVLKALDLPIPSAKMPGLPLVTSFNFPQTEN
ncbi:MAG TPA: alkaline phosphatase family protein [Pricia sp.]|nr:alkaline phosphatase family protein [Pricia sp.]